MSQEQLFASFMLDKDSGLEIALHAGDVIEATPVQGTLQPLPGGVDFLEGIMQLREKTVPVINLKKRFGLASTSYAAGAKVAVVGIYDQHIGLLVDDIREVFRVDPEAVTPVSPMLQSGDRIISALIQLDKGRRTAELLDLKAIFKGEPEDFAGGAALPPAAGVRKPTIWSRFVVFHCRGQEYGVPVKYAQEITFLTEIDEMFKSGLLEGALNLRGRTVPVMSAARLLAPAMETDGSYHENSRILVMASEECCFGLIVEDVREILAVADDEVLPLPSGQGSNLTGIFSKPSGSDVLLLDMPSLVCGHIDDLKSMTRLKNGGKGGAAGPRGPVSATHHLITENCYLVFSIDKHFAIELKDVREIIENSRLLRIPGDTDYRSGVINLRGEVVPVVNLHRFYSLPEASAEKAAGNRLIICRAHDQTVALEVDQIVTIYKQEKYHATPSLHPRLAARKDTLDRLIEFTGGETAVEHVLVVNIYNLVRNHLELGTGRDTYSGEQEQAPPSGKNHSEY